MVGVDGVAEEEEDTAPWLAAVVRGITLAAGADDGDDTAVATLEEADADDDTETEVRCPESAAVGRALLALVGRAGVDATTIVVVTVRVEVTVTVLAAEAAGMLEDPT